MSAGFCEADAPDLWKRELCLALRRAQRRKSWLMFSAALPCFGGRRGENGLCQGEALGALARRIETAA